MADAPEVEPVAWAVRSDDSETVIYHQGSKYVADGLGLGFPDIATENFDTAVDLARELNARKAEVRAAEARLMWLRTEPLGEVAHA